MTFQELSILIHTKRQPNYAELLLTHADPIMREVGRTNKAQTARGLKMSPNTFSLVYQLILAHVELTKGV